MVCKEFIDVGYFTTSPITMDKRERRDSEVVIPTMSRRVEGEAGEGRLPAIGLRTLSIHVDTEVSSGEEESGSGRNRTAAVKGSLQLFTLFFLAYLLFFPPF